MNPVLPYIKAGLKGLLVGPPGIAKTALIRSAAESAGLRPVIVRASLSERVDWGGALIPDTAKGITRALPLELLADLQRTNKPTLLFLDDLGQAPIDVQAALMRLFDAGALSDSVLIWGATNRPGDKAGVSSLCEPLRSRFDCAFAMPTPDGERKADHAQLCSWSTLTDQWIEWAFSIGAPAEVIAWHRATSGSKLYAWQPCSDPAVRMPDFRSWQSVIRARSAGLTSNAMASIIGNGAAAEFCAFCDLASQLPTPDQVWMDPAGAPVPTDPSALYLIATLLAMNVSQGQAGALVTYMERMPQVYAALCGRDAYRRLGAMLAGSAEWQRWFRENQTLFGAQQTAA